ncbi:hypothetical protein FKM82_013857 [Ascaphus truei]
MAESVLEVVEKLQSRLSANTEPKKLQKTLKRLAELPITVDILVETGVGKAVNGLRKHELVGDLAKSLVAQWKKLVPQEAQRVADPEEREHSKSSVRKRPRSPSPREDEAEEDYEEDVQPIHRSDMGHRRLAEPQRGFRKEPVEENWRQYSDREDSDDGQGYSPEPPHSPPSLYVDTCRSETDTKDRTHHKPSKEHKSSHKEKHRPEGKSLNSERKREKLASKETPQDPPSAGSSREKLLSPESREHPCKKEKSRHSVSRSQAEDSTDTKKQKHHEKYKREKQRQDVDMQTAERGKRPVEREAEPGSGARDKHKGKPRTPEASEQDKKCKLSVPVRDPSMDDEFERPTQSFESCLSYDLPQKKKKKPVAKPVATSSDRASKKQSESRAEPRSKDTSKQKEPAPAKDRGARKRESPPVMSTKIDQVPVLPDIPLPYYRPLPSTEAAPFSPQKRKAPVTSAQEDEESSGFTGRRFNSKMQVYSGSKTAYLPKMTSLYQQCIRVLANNIDSIYEVGGVPYSVLEPVLEKCTPDQLYRIEECNHVLVEDTDRLWMNHCQRDFKKEKAEEFESWREMYLRLHEAREQRLLLLTQNIRSAHANKPKGGSRPRG